MRAHALLVESISASAHEELNRNGIAVETAAGALNGQDMIDALNGLPGDGPVIVGIRSKSHIRKEIFDAVPRLTTIGAFCIGTDQIDLEEASQRGIGVFNAPFSSTRSVAELVLGQIIMLSRQIFPRNKAAHDGVWAKSAKGAHEIRGKTLGIIGYGHIGSQLSILAEAAGMRVLYFDIVTKLPLGNAESRQSLMDLLGECDFVSLHVPDTELTRGMMDHAAIGEMKKGAYLINASRGQVVDIDALKKALVDGRLAGAAIDVFPTEPAKAGDPFESPLRGLDNVILTPHIGGSTLEAQANIGREVAATLVRFMTLGSTTGCVTLPEQEAPPFEAGCRLFNVHRNVPGVLSQVNRVIAESEMNIVGQRLATAGELGLLLVDVVVDPRDERIRQLSEAVAALPTSVHTRVIS
jgi:D-3-phosphoglycerate dehydrogenase